MATALAGSTWLAGGCDESDGVRGAPENASATPDAATRPKPDQADAAGQTRGPDAQVALPIDDDPMGRDASSVVIIDPAGEDASLATPVETDSSVADTGVAPKGVSCDDRAGKVLCKRTRPECPEGQVPSVVEACWGECTPIDHCACNEPDACPERETYVCHKSAGHCGPYVN